MTPARRLVAENARRTPVPRWVRRVFAATTLTGAVVALLVFALLYREADHGHLSVEAAVVLLLGSYALITTGGMALFMRIALPPVYAQTEELERTLARQLEVNRRQQDFLVHVHHELRTPVTVVLGATQLLASYGDELPHDQRTQLREAAARNAHALSALVEDLTASVDEALPGLAADGAVDNWSSTRTRRRVGVTGTGPMGAVDTP